MRILPSGQRAGFFIGDAAGVGKGRQVRSSHVRDVGSCFVPNKFQILYVSVTCRYTCIRVHV